MVNDSYLVIETLTVSSVAQILFLSPRSANRHVGYKKLTSVETERPVKL
jgi:hypothetical protein